MKFLTQIMASAFGLGYAPVASGTFGSLWGCLAFFLLKDQPRIYLFGLTLLISVIGTFFSHRGEKVFGEKDSGKIVIDEVAGQLLTYLFVPFSWFNLIVGFLLFRGFDILKLFPANWAQDKLPGGYGVMGDDLVAGVQAGLLLLLIQYLYRFFV